MSFDPEKTTLWTTLYDPLPDVTAWEVAIDRKIVNASWIIASYECDNLGSALRHRVDRDTGKRMDEVWREHSARSSALPRKQGE